MELCDITKGLHFNDKDEMFTITLNGIEYFCCDILIEDYSLNITLVESYDFNKNSRYLTNGNIKSFLTDNEHLLNNDMNVYTFVKLHNRVIELL